MEESKKLQLYLLMLSRYKDLINEKESKTVTEIKEKVTPHHPVVEGIRKKLLSPHYIYERDFLAALNKAMDYIGSVETIEFSINFWMDFADIERIGAADSVNKALLFTALLRNFGSDNAKVVITKSDAYYVSFIYDSKTYLFSAKTNSLLLGEDVSKLLSSDQPKCMFNDRTYENFEE
jgi:hypothetical protein